MHAGTGACLLRAGERQSHFLSREECARAGEKIALPEGSALMPRRDVFPSISPTEFSPLAPVYIYRHELADQGCYNASYIC